MVQSFQGFPHINLKLTTEGRAVLRGRSTKSPQTITNLSNRQGHGSKLKGSLESVIFDWQQDNQEKPQEEHPQFKSRRIILQIDPGSFDPDGLKAFGIELIADTEDGYIIGASADIELSELQKKIEKFINQEYGGNKVAEIWEIIDGKKKPELILSPTLFAELYGNWLPIKEEQIYTVDVGVACVGTATKLPNYPKRQPHDTDEIFTKKVNTWIPKRELTEDEWEKLSWERQDEFEEIIEFYKGNIIKGFQDDGGELGTVRLPDSFSCRIQISGKGLKDLIENYPYIFEISSADQFSEMLYQEESPDSSTPNFQLEAADSNAPKVCIIDSGIQEMHSLLKAAIDSPNSTSWVPGETGKTPDYVKNGGHGTRVAGALLYPKKIPRSGKEKAICWIQNARVLDADCYLPIQIFPPHLLENIVEFYHNLKTRIFNHSITGQTPCLTRYMSAWASTIDNLTWHKDILVIVAAGNLPSVPYPKKPITRLSIREHLSANRLYPDYLLENSCRIANPAQSFQALTVGSIALNSYHIPPYSSIGQKDQPSAFSCSGFGIWNTIKPEVVEYGGDLVKDEGTPLNILLHKDVAPELVRSTLYGGPAVGFDKVGTSFAAPKVSHIAARLAAELPNESCLLYRALIVQSARWPEWTMADEVNKLHVVRQIGYGLPNVERAVGNTPNRITLMTAGERRIVAKQAHVYQVKLPEKLRSPGENFKILVEVTLSYKAQPRRTRRNRRKYLSTWLDWDCSKKGEDTEKFLERILKEYDAPEDAEKGDDGFQWTLGKKSKKHGKIDGVSRSAGTIQKDWTVVNSFELTDAFSIAVVGHEGWNNDPEASVPYSLVVSFEAIRTDISIYTSMVEAQIETEVKTEVEIQSL
ncbi:S8 family peptidase [Cronbergia sp. UHCC 0137]|uniref:S8 family peptidase n=1 Tax=Cronbergia sp. UHCC 0137 TaxID=3110239 RepID=UPI002B1FD93D|nr:S8 family peptidase [Cronbergia sp. UHCC 0137]MEA5620331.1 S8 family peptidase [Cronbergia sp. UHCC 0137]